MKTRMIIAGVAIAATLSLSGCKKTETENVSVNDTAMTADNMTDMNEAADNSANMSNGDAMQGDLTHP